MIDDLENLMFFPYNMPMEEARQARDAAVKMLWSKRGMLHQNLYLYMLAN